ncbi:DNA breaking-rejoining enzyme, partial [Suillus hirtellus]
NTPPPSTIDHPIVCLLAEAAGRASLRETASYGSGIRKFHLFCDIFSIPEPDRLPASFELLHSFALWAASDPSTLNPIARDPAAESIPFEPVSVTVVKKYLSAIRAWHLAQGWSPPLSAENLTRISWSLRGLENLQGARRKPLRPPVTLQKLTAIKATLKLDQPFDACIWAIASCSFFGMMRFGEVSVRTRTEFNASKHITRKDVLFGVDLNGKSYARLDLPSAKTAKPGETQSVFLVEQGNLCPLEALRNLARVVPASPNNPLFSWRDNKGFIRPMVKTRAIETINRIMLAWGWGTMFGHSFRIGGASFYLASKVDPEIVRIAGRWKSLAYETYIRAFEQVASQHLGNLS